MSSQIADLLTLAKEQGWNIEHTNKGHLKWYPPDGGPYVLTGPNPIGGNFYNARANLLSAGLRAREGEKMCTQCETIKPHGAFSRNNSRNDGLQVWCKACQHGFDANRPSRAKAPPPAEVTAEPSADEPKPAPGAIGEADSPMVRATAHALDAAVAMVYELAEQFAAFRTATQSEIAELRGITKNTAADVPALKGILTDMTRLQNGYVSRNDLQEILAVHLQHVKETADPIAAFRERLK